MNLLEAKNISFSYFTSGQETRVLKNVSLNIKQGEFVGIQGKSGSGKSTLFHILGCLLKPTQGTVHFNGVQTNTFSQDEASLFRNKEIGFVFQQFFLLPRATVLENILLPSNYPLENKVSSGNENETAIKLAEKVGLSHRLHHHPNQLSGGEQQRVAIARALMNNCSLILADEPTGNLDSKNTDNILELLHALNKEGKTVVLITHDAEIAARCPSLYQMTDGEIQTVRHRLSTNTVSFKSAPQEKIRSSSFLKLLRAALPQAIENLSRNRMRAFLTMIGVSVGIAAVYAMLSFGEFAKEKVVKGYEEMGANTVMIEGHWNWEKKATDYVPIPFEGFSMEKDLEPLKNIFPQIELISPMMAEWGTTLSYNGKSTPPNQVMVWGIGESMMRMINRPLLSGRPLSIFHILNADPVCLIGTEIKEQLFQSSNPLGAIIFVTTYQKSYHCKVIGVLANATSNQDWRHPNREVYVPYTFFATVSDFWRSKIHDFVVQFKSGTDAQKLSKALKTFFEQKYGNAGKFMENSNLLLVQQMKKAVFLFTLLLVSIAIITLTVGGIGINNMMMVSISERFREIGLRKALGATNKSIRLQFLLESITLSLIAGAIGVVIGFATYQAVIFGASKMVSKIQFEWVFPIYPLVLSVVSILLVGIFSGIFPALKAEKLQVIEALRNE